jgi:hypothetical protein
MARPRPRALSHSSVPRSSNFPGAGPPCPTGSRNWAIVRRVTVNFRNVRVCSLEDTDGPSRRIRLARTSGSPSRSSVPNRERTLGAGQPPRGPRHCLEIDTYCLDLWQVRDSTRSRSRSPARAIQKTRTPFGGPRKSRGLVPKSSAAHRGGSRTAGDCLIGNRREWAPDVPSLQSDGTIE